MCFFVLIFPGRRKQKTDCMSSHAQRLVTSLAIANSFGSDCGETVKVKTSRHQVKSRFKEAPWQLIVGVRGVSPGHRQAPLDTKSPGAHSTTTHCRPPRGTSTPGKDDDMPPKLRNVCFRRHRANSYLKETPCQLIACPRGISTCRRKPPFDTKSPGAHSTTPPFPRAPGLRPP